MISGTEGNQFSPLNSLASFRDIDQTMEDWYLSSLDHKLSQIHDYLKEQLAVCRQHIREFHTLFMSFSASALKINLLSYLLYIN